MPLNRLEAIEICRRYSLAPNKKLGQNFLVSVSVVRRILEAMGLAGSESVLEVGPGLGAISEGIAAAAARYTAVEIDSGIFAYLGERFHGLSSVKLVHGDFLKEHVADEYDVIISNLPYYCTSEMLFRFAEDFSAPRVFVMVQKELADRIMSKPGTKAYGALTVGLAFHFRVSALFSVPRDSFYPAPEVNSSFISLMRIVRPPEQGKVSASHFRRIVKSSFWGRRKTLLKALSESPHLSLRRDTIAAAMERMGLKVTIRGETLGLDEFIELARLLPDDTAYNKGKEV